MFRILSPSGKVYEFEKAIPICEVTVNLNGEKHHVFEKAKNLKVNPTGILLKSTEPGGGLWSPIANEVYVGNLPAPTVKVILSELTSQGYYDFTRMQYQQAEFLADVTIDEGASKPYTSDITNMIGITCEFDSPVKTQPVIANNFIIAKVNDAEHQDFMNEPEDGEEDEAL